MNRVYPFIIALAACGLLSACAPGAKPMDTVDNVDIQRFMGDWYVIANIPTFLEKNAYNAVETYSLEGDGRIATTFTFRKGGFDGKPVEYNPTGFVSEASNAIWGMQFIWPIKADYRIIYLDDRYTQTIIGRTARDHVWIMARTPSVSDEDYAKLVRVVEDAGYDASDLKTVPQRW